MHLTDEAVTSWGLKWRWHYLPGAKSLIWLTLSNDEAHILIKDDPDIEINIPEEEKLHYNNQRYQDELVYLIRGLRKQSKNILQTAQSATQEYAKRWARYRGPEYPFLRSMIRADAVIYLSLRTSFFDELREYLFETLGVKDKDQDIFIKNLEDDLKDIAITTILETLNQ